MYSSLNNIHAEQEKKMAEAYMCNPFPLVSLCHLDLFQYQNPADFYVKQIWRGLVKIYKKENNREVVF